VIDLFEGMYESEHLRFQPVADDDPLMDVQYPVQGVNATSLHNGIRHMVIHIPRGDFGRDFQLRDTHNANPWRFMVNLFQYVIEKKRPRNRLESYHQPGPYTDQGQPVAVVQAEHAGRWNPEPLAWRRLGAFSRTVAPAPRSTPLAGIADEDAPLVHLVGSETMTFAEDQIQAMRRYVQRGGVLLIEAAGGSDAFFQSARQALTDAFPDHRVRPINRRSPIIHGGEQGTDASTVDYRLYHQQTLGFASDRPGLMGMEIDGQMRVILVPDDLSGGMAGLQRWGILGYQPESARKLASNIALHARQLRAEADAAVSENP